MRDKTRVTLKPGWWVYVQGTSSGFTASGQESGTVDGRFRHEHPGTVYVNLDDGRRVSAAIAGITEKGR